MWHEIMKEVILLWSVHKKAFWMIVFVPILYTLLFGSLFYEGSLTKVPIIIENYDDGAQGRRFEQAFYDTPEFIIVDSTAVSYGTIIIPSDFSKKLDRGDSVSIEVVIDNTNTVIGGSIMKSIQTIVATYNAGQEAMNRISVGWTPQVAQAEAAPVVLSSRSLYNSTGGYNDFFLVVLIVHALQIGTVFVIGPSMVLEKRRRRDKLLRHPWQCLAAKLVVYTAIETVTFVVCLSLAAIIFKLVLHGNAGGILSLTILFSATMTSFGLCAGSWLKDPVKAITYALFYIMPSVLFSGAIWPRTSMDSISLALTYIMPIGYAADNMRDLLVRGFAPNLLVDMVAMLMMGSIFFLAAGCGLKRTLGGNDRVQHYKAGMEHSHP
jgi:ABC-2 type transport system permease protein